MVLSDTNLKPSPHTDVGIFHEADFETWHINITATNPLGPFSWLVDIGGHTIQPGEPTTYDNIVLAYHAALNAAALYFKTQIDIARSQMAIIEKG